MTLTNQPEPFSVSELSQKLKRTLEQNFDHVRVRGELSKVKIHTSGHLYTDLKDQNSVINSVCWRGTVNTLSIRPEEGMEVICTGKITTYPARSNYQLVIETMELAGQGALLKLLEDRKKRLEAEGLFAPERKRRLPFLPQRIGVITSPTGAVIQDILHRIAERFPRHVLLWPVFVQGENTVRDVVGALQGFHTLTPHLRPDIIIIARGGGSLEDLMPFNDEAIVRAVADSTIPIISAVGHESDTTLIDFVSDRRAPTPTAAAEMAVPVLIDLINTISVHGQRLNIHIANRIKHNRNDMRNFYTALGDPQNIIRMQQQRLDYIDAKAQHGLKHMLVQARHSVAKFAALGDPQHIIRLYRQRLELISGRTQNMLNTVLGQARHSLTKAQGHLRHPRQMLDLLRQKLTGTSQLLESYSFKNVLARGYALILNEQNHVMDTKDEAQKEKALTIRFADGDLRVRRDG